ncbi:MAG: DUF975 family protein [Clostridia bacterium]|nr:DUF975 family protein [Clostridia bacterium]
MWKRKELKDKAKKVIKKNYWTAIVICFLIALFTGEFGTSIMGIFPTDDSMDPYYIISHPDTIFESNQTETEKQNEILKRQEEIVENLKTKKENLSDTQLKIVNVIESYLDSMTKSQKFIFKISDAVKSFIVDKDVLGIGLAVMSIVSIAFSILIANPLIVSLRRYFIEARKKQSTKINVVLDIFKKQSWLSIAITMLLKDIFTFLWFLTIIGGFIKIYEYAMIPYILGDNPKMKWKETFKLSKQMMKGNKWKLFVLDLSFIGWEILSLLTFGLLNIFYVNPYKIATNVELYEVLKKDAIKNKYEYYEELK